MRRGFRQLSDTLSANTSFIESYLTQIRKGVFANFEQLKQMKM